MLNKKYITRLLLSLCLTLSTSYAQPGADGLGQTIQITTRFQSFVGNPSWLLIIRDIDHGQNIPYLFDINSGENFWVAFSYSRNYLILASTLQISTYQSRYNSYKNYKIHNFCHLESNGRIMRGESMFVTIQGDLSPNSDSYSCQISTYADTNFTFANEVTE